MAWGSTDSMPSRATEIDYTLRRNGIALGRLRIGFPVEGKTPGIAGMLEVDSAFTDIDEIMQSVVDILPGKPTFLALTRDSLRGPGPHGLKQMTPEETKGVAPEKIFSLHDASGAEYPIRFLAIHRFPEPIPDDAEGELIDICRARGITPSPWMLMAH